MPSERSKAMAQEFLENNGETLTRDVENSTSQWMECDKVTKANLEALLDRRAEEERRETAKVVRRVLDSFGCTCDEAYTSRNLTAPDCARHNSLDDMADEILRRIDSEEGR